MSQKEKIIILLSSLFCGFPLIFFSLRSHQNQKKNNLSITKKEKKEENINKEKENEIINNQDNQKEDFFWIVVVIVIFVILIIIWIIYRYLLKNKDNGQDNISNKDDHQRNLKPEYHGFFPTGEISDKDDNKINKNDSNQEHYFSTEEPKGATGLPLKGMKILGQLNGEKIIANLDHDPLKPNNDLNNFHDHDLKNEEKEELLKQKNSMKCYLNCQINSFLEIVLAKNDNINNLNQVAITNIFEADLDQLIKMGVEEKIIQEQLPLEKILKMITSYLTTYLTGQLLGDFCQAKKIDKEKYPILTTMTEKMINSQENFLISLYKKKISVEKPNREANEDEYTYLQNNNLIELLESVMSHDQATFMKYDVVEVNGANHEQISFLFLYLYNLVKLFEQIDQEISLFFQDQIKNTNQRQKYETLLIEIQNNCDEIEKLIYPKSSKILNNYYSE